MVVGFDIEATEPDGQQSGATRIGVELAVDVGCVHDLGEPCEREITSQVDPTYTDVAGALKLALASFPEGTAKRVVLISDGNENLGNAEEQARIAKQNGVQIDVVPIATRQQQQNEILVERIEAPPMTEKDSFGSPVHLTFPVDAS